MKILILLLLYIQNLGAIEIGEKVKNFSLKAEDGKEYELNNFKGKTIVLEWLNHGCPFVKKHYGSKNMQETQKKARAMDVIWLSIISSAPGKQGHVNPQEAKQEMSTHGSRAHHILLDPTGKVGQMFGAQTTPHMFIIGKDQSLLYQGAIDSIRSTDPSDISKATNYITQALDEIQSNKKISIAKTKAYGCSVKY